MTRCPAQEMTSSQVSGGFWCNAPAGLGAHLAYASKADLRFVLGPGVEERDDLEVDWREALAPGKASLQLRGLCGSGYGCARACLGLPQWGSCCVLAPPFPVRLTGDQRPGDYSRALAARRLLSSGNKVRSPRRLQEWPVVWLPRPNGGAGFSGGWRGFSINLVRPP